jgi:hypothetical protein
LTFAQLAKKMGPKKKKEKAAPEPKDKSETISKLYYDEESGYQSKAEDLPDGSREGRQDHEEGCGGLVPRERRGAEAPLLQEQLCG